MSWDSRARSWDDWGPPLRPCRRDIELYRGHLSDWHASISSVGKKGVLLLGVTPELALEEWPFDFSLLAIDRSKEMIDAQWPGDVPGKKAACQSDWLHNNLPAGFFSAVIGDGVPVFFPKPDALFQAVRRLLAPDGVFVCRFFVSPPVRESLSAVLESLRAGHVPTFHSFKWRVAMSLQADPEEGVRQHDVWEAVMSFGVDLTRLYPEREVATIRFYRDSQDRLHFPTWAQYGEALSREFSEISAEFPSYELGIRCPVVAARV